MSMRAGWTPRILGAVLALAAGWFLLTHADGFLPAFGQVAGLGPTALPVGLALVALGVLNRALQAHASFRLVELPARFGTMVHLSATSYATNKMVKSAGTAGLVPFLAHADRAGHERAPVVAAYLSTKLAETMSLCCLIGVAVVAGAATGGLHGSALWGALASAGYALVVGAALVLIAGRRSVVAAIAKRARRVAFHFRSRFGRPQPEPGGACAGHELSCAMDRLRADPRAAIPLVGTAFAGKLLGCAGLFMVLTGLGIHLGVATTLLVYTLTLMVALVGPIPGGIGIADASLGALLVANGVSGPSAAAAVVAFRLLDLWIPLLVGAAAGAGQYRRNRNAPADVVVEAPRVPVLAAVGVD
jgi:uncharacterized membrane protein YbhN (UPF0104 family)